MSKVLIADDDRLIVQLFRDVLSKDYVVVTAGDGEEALALLRREPVDAIVVDHMMPKMTGVDVLRVARDIQPNAARILVTASDRLELAKDAVNLGRVHGFAAKPVKPLELLSEIVAVAIRDAKLESENARLVTELKQALIQVEANEQKLEEEVQRRTQELRAAVAKLQELALRDGLTNLYNHRFFQEALLAEVARAQRHGRKLALVFLDVDNFKNYNDKLGHPKGDEFLKQIARILTNTGEVPEIRVRGRVSDVVARYGGEEFVIILPEADKAGALLRAERVRAEIESFPFEGREIQPGGRATVSIGVASFPEDGTTKSDLIRAADQALLRAKREGRNRVMAA